jgi:PAS domain S-box-containing protein
LTLSFPPVQEREFQEHYFRSSLRQVRIAYAMGLLFYAAFGLLDSILVPEVKVKLWLIRFGFACPLILFIFPFSFSRYFQKYMQLAISTTVVMSGLAIVGMIAIAPYPASHLYYAGLILCLIYGYTFFRLRFIWASVAGWVIVLSYEVAATWVNPTPVPILINNNFFLLSSNLFGMFACYSIELYLRRDFVQARLLEKEKKKVDQANFELEKRVEERTAQLVGSNRELKQEISDRERFETALRESEEKYRLLVQNADTAIFIVQDGIVKFPNPKAVELTGYSEEELGKSPFIQFMHPEDRTEFLDRHMRVLEGEDPPSSFIFRLINREEQELHVQLNMVVILWEKRIATLNFLRDITAQRKLEARLQQAQKMEAIGTLAGGVAHDLNNILAGLVSYPELLLLDLPPNSPLRRSVMTIQKSGQMAAAIVQDLLTLARRGVSSEEVVTLNDVIRQYMQSIEYEKLASFHPHVTVETRLDPKLGNIVGSPVHLSKTLMNLVTNAAEAMPGGGRIRITTENRRIDTPLKGYETIREGEFAVFTIADQGIGISANDVEKIFEPFYTKKVMGRSGTGLGMAVVWGTVKDHRGYIDVQSTVGRGTTFTLFFPLTHRSSRLHKVQKAPFRIEDAMGRGERILVIDDIQEQRDIASVMLKRIGYRVTAVKSGEEAVRYMEQNTADVLVLDMIMPPGMDGLDTYRRILSMHPGQRAVIASGYSETDRAREAQKLGAKVYLKKPYSLEKIAHALRSALDDGTAKGVARSASAF